MATRVPTRVADWRGSHNHGLEQLGGGRHLGRLMSPGVVDIAADRNPRPLHAAMRTHANPLQWSPFQESCRLRHSRCSATRREGHDVRELEATLQRFGEFLLQAQLVKEKAAPYCVRWVRR
ncbi:MAG: hypothetical protein HYV04_22290, partial [Deltaproteobacteria bacterium]|nr:hypothetical protein [Deltaproteobacteria bacterium]